MPAALLLGDSGAPVWRLLTVAVVGWYVVDSILLLATGFTLFVISDTVNLAAFHLPMACSGVFRQGERRTRFGTA